jgi:hypothetical protein
VRFAWGDLRLTAARLEYDADAARIVATGNVVLVRGDETIRGETVAIDLAAGAFGADRAVVVSPPFYVRGGRVERTAGRLTATDALLTTCPSGRGEFSITAARVEVDQNDADLLLKDASLRLFGLRLVTVRSWRIPLPSGDNDRDRFGPLPINVRASRISGFALGFTPTFQIAERTELQTRLDLPTRRAVQYGATLSRDLIAVPGPRLPPRASSPAAVFAEEFAGPAPAAGAPAESPLRRLLRARRLPTPDPVLDYESVLTRTGVGPDALLRPARVAGPGLTGQFTVTGNQEIGGKRQGLLQLSRAPEVALIGQLPLGYGRLPVTSDDAAFRAWLRTPRPVLEANLSYGSYRERRLQQNRATIRDERTSATVGLSTLPLLIGDRLLVRPLVRVTQNWYGRGGDPYRFAEADLSAQYTLGQRTAVGAAYVNRGIAGSTPFTFDQIDTQTEAQFWGQSRYGRFTFAGLGRYDLKQGKLFDYELSVAVRGCSIEPRLSYRRLGGQFGINLALPGLTTF